MASGEPLLEKLWKHKAEEEKGETLEEKGITLFYDLKEKAEKYPDLKSLTDEMERGIGDYADAVIRTSHERAKGSPREDIQSADQHRRSIHDALIATVNQLSRLYHKKGFDNSWRSGIIGIAREDLGAWAVAIARDVLGKKFDAK